MKAKFSLKNRITMYLRALGFALFLGAVSSAFGQSILSQADLSSAALDAAIRERMDEAGIVGIGAAIVIDKQLVWSNGYGFANREKGVQFTPDTVMNIGSISKTVTGVAMMRAVQEKKLSLDGDINRFLTFKITNPHRSSQPISLRHLATHTSSINDRWPIYEAGYHFGGDAPERLGDFLKNYLTPSGNKYSVENFLDVNPGEQRNYSNIGAGLAGFVVENAVAEKLNRYTQSRIFQPLKMKNTGWFLTEIDRAKHAQLYVSQGGITFPIQNYGVPTYPDGGVRTSVSDLSKLFITLLNGGEYQGTRILDRAISEEMLRFQFSEERKPQNIEVSGDNASNSGLFWTTKFNGTRMGHNGSDPGVRTMMLCNLDRSIGVILFSNTSLGDEAMGSFVMIFEELWKHAEALRDATSGSRHQTGR